MELHWLKRKNEAGEDIKFYPITHKDAIIDLNADEFAKQADLLEHIDNTNESINDINEALQNVSTIKDWDQNDELHPDYIRNRTHWKEDLGVAEILPTTSVTTALNSGANIARNPFDPLELIIGDIYIATFNGNEYNCTCVMLDGIPCFGNASLVPFFSGSQNTGEPFLVACSTEMGMSVIWTDVAGTHTINIKHNEFIYHPFDKKYIPAVDELKLNTFDGREFSFTLGAYGPIITNSEAGTFEFALRGDLNNYVTTSELSTTLNSYTQKTVFDEHVTESNAKYISDVSIDGTSVTITKGDGTSTNKETPYATTTYVDEALANFTGGATDFNDMTATDSLGFIGEASASVNAQTLTNVIMDRIVALEALASELETI